jgi:hypothetical protein
MLKCTLVSRDYVLYVVKNDFEEIWVSVRTPGLVLSRSVQLDVFKSDDE